MRGSGVDSTAQLVKSFWKFKQGPNDMGLFRSGKLPPKRVVSIFFPFQEENVSAGGSFE